MKKIILSACIIFGITLAATAQNRYIGEKFGGGVIFWLNADGISGFIAAEKDLPETMNWDQANDSCEKLNLNGFENWHLPTKDELNELYLQKTLVGGLKNDFYWSSRDYNVNANAVLQFFGDGGQRDEDKTNHYLVRAVRAFSLSGINPGITIGNQTWMSKNLEVTTYRDGTEIPHVTDPSDWGNLTTGAWCYYENNSDNGTTYGKLYNWYAVNDPRGLAPQGWHIPSDEEWSTLETTLGGNNFAGGKMKVTGTTTWNSPNTEATNTSGFAAQPGGYRLYDGSFCCVSTNGFWWTATEYSPAGGWDHAMYNYNSNSGRAGSNKLDGFSVRSVKD